MIIKKLTDFSFVEQFLSNTFSSPSHWPEWNLVISKHYSTDFYYLAAYENDQLIGICPVHDYKIGPKIVSNSGQFYYNPYGGWIHNRDTLVNIKKIHLRFNQEMSCFSLPLLKEFNTDYTNSNNHKLETLVIELDKPYEEIFNNSFDSDVRKRIRKALKNNVTIKIDNDIDQFYFYFKKSCEERSLHLPVKAFFTDLFQTSKNIKFMLYWAMVGAKVLGFSVTVRDKDFSIGLFSYLIHSANLGQGELLISEVLKDAQHNGCHYLDFCFIEKDKLPTIYAFKKKFSKTEVQINYFNKRPIPYRILNKLIKANIIK